MTSFMLAEKEKQLSGKHERITLSFKMAELLNPGQSSDGLNVLVLKPNVLDNVP